MSFYIYTANIGLLNGKMLASLDTDDPTFVGMPLLTKTLYINGLPFGRIQQQSSLPYDAAGYGESVNNTVGPYEALLFHSYADFTDYIMSVEVRDYFYFIGKLVAQDSVTLYTDDPKYTTLAAGSLAGQAFYTGKTLLGNVISNTLFDGNKPDGPHGFSYNNGVFINATGKVLSAIHIQPAVGAVIPTAVDSITLSRPTTKDWVYSTASTVGTAKFAASECGALYKVSPSLLEEPIQQGKLGLYINGKFTAPVIGIKPVFGYADTSEPNQLLPMSALMNPWDVKKLLGYYVTSIVSNAAEIYADITSVELKPYYKVSKQGDTLRVAVAGPPDGSAGVAMIDLVNSCSAGRNLYVDGREAGEVTSWGNVPLYIDGHGPLNFSDNPTDPTYKEYFFEVANPLFWPLVDQGVRLSLDSAEISGLAELINGAVVLNGIPPIAEGVDGLVGKRLIINEQFIGIVISNTLDVIVTGLTVQHADFNIPVSMAGIWRLETVDAVGRVPLCTATQTAVCNVPAYPMLNVAGLTPGDSYAYNPASFNYYPNGTEVYTRRDNVDINSTHLRILGHKLPSWVEHASLDHQLSTFLLVDRSAAIDDLTEPAITKYVTTMSVLAELPLNVFSQLWQWGRVRVNNYADIRDGVWNTLEYENETGNLANPACSLSSTTDFTLSQAFTTDVLCYVGVVEVAVPPTAVAIETTVITSASASEMTSLCGVYEFAAAVTDLATATVVEHVSAAVSVSNSITTVLAPVVTASIAVGKTSSAVKSGTTIQFKRGNLANLPASASIGEPLVTLDTGELFIGTGTGLRKVSDIVTSDIEPGVTDRNKVWYNPTTNETHIYKDGSWQAVGAEASLDYGDF